MHLLCFFKVTWKRVEKRWYKILCLQDHLEPYYKIKVFYRKMMYYKTLNNNKHAFGKKKAGNTNVSF